MAAHTKVEMGVLFDVTPVHHALAPLLAFAYPNADLTPTILTSNLVTRAKQRETLSALLEDFDATLETVAHLGDALARITSGLKQRRGRIKMALAPVTGLPTEILREIFLIAGANDTTSKVHIIASHVSSHWRSVIIGIKQLWTAICYPGMMHECAERAGDQRLHLTPISGARWPPDLEATPAEVSRISTWLLRLGLYVDGRSIDRPPDSFVRSLASISVLMPSKVVIMGPETACRDPHVAQAFTLSHYEHDALMSGCAKQLTEVVVSNMPVFSCSCFLAELSRDAPLFSQLQLCTIFGDDVSEYGVEDVEEVDQAYAIEPPYCCSQLVSLTVEGCCEGVYAQVLDNWVMPNLISLTLDLRSTPGQQDESNESGSLSDSLTSLVGSLLLRCKNGLVLISFRP